MEIELSDQPPVCNQTLNNFVKRNEAELINTSQKVKVLFYDYEIVTLKPICDTCKKLSVTKNYFFKNILNSD